VVQFRHQKFINRLQSVCTEVSSYYCFRLRLFRLHGLESAYLSASKCTFLKTRQPAVCSDITKTVVIKFTPKTTARVPLDIHIKDNLIDEVNALNV